MLSCLQMLTFSSQGSSEICKKYDANRKLLSEWKVCLTAEKEHLLLPRVKGKSLQTTQRLLCKLMVSDGNLLANKSIARRFSGLRPQQFYTLIWKKGRISWPYLILLITNLFLFCDRTEFFFCCIELVGLRLDIMAAATQCTPGFIYTTLESIL